MSTLYHSEKMATIALSSIKLFIQSLLSLSSPTSLGCQTLKLQARYWPNEVLYYDSAHGHQPHGRRGLNKMKDSASSINHSIRGTACKRLLERDL